MITHKIKDFFYSLLLKEPSPSKLALAFSIGVYIAFSPFPGLHTLMVVLLSWLLSLNFFVTFAVNTMVNNPWTMVPVYTADYFCGDAICYTMFGHNFMHLNPAWMQWFNAMIARYLGFSEVSLYSFLIGGNILGIVAAFLSYPLVLYVFTKIIPSSPIARHSRNLS